MNWKERCSGQTWSNSRERKSNFSLEYRAIRPSAIFGTRRKAALRREGFAWVSNLGSFLKLRDVGVSPYLRENVFDRVIQVELLLFDN